MTDPIREALERLVETIEGIELEGLPEVDEALAAARAALAAASDGPAVPEGIAGEPSDEELAELAELFNDDPVPAMRRALQLWGRPASAPAGEVGELVSWLGVVSEQFRLAELDDEATQTDRAATPLNKQEVE